MSNIYVAQLADMLSNHKEILKEFPFMYVSEAIGEEYKEWKDGDFVFIDAPTGTGKTTFIYEKIIVKALEDNVNVLLVSNRIALSMQQKRKIYDVISKYKPEALGTLKKDKISKNTILIGPVCVITYQSLYGVFSSTRFKPDKNGAKKRQKFLDWCSKIRYAVFDEIHFLYSDAEFNNYCGYLVNYIPFVFKQFIRIYITATSWDVLDYIQKYEDHTYTLNIYNPPSKIINTRFNLINNSLSFHHYVIKPDYSKYELKFFDLESSKTAINVKLASGTSDNDSLICKANLRDKRISKAAAVLNIMDPPPSNNNKWIVFVDSKREGDDLKKVLREAGVSAAYVDREISEPQKVRNEIIQNEKFSQPVLITTQVLDSGINICDEAVKNIVIFYTDRTEFIQSLGRKRLLSEETGVTIWAWVPSVESFSRRWVRYSQNVLVALSALFSAEALKQTISLIMRMGMGSPHLYDNICYSIDEDGMWKNTLVGWEKVLTKDALNIIMSFLHSPEFNNMKQYYMLAPTAQSNSISELIYQIFQPELIANKRPECAVGIQSLLSRTIYMYLAMKESIEEDQKNEIVKSLFYIEKMGLYSVDTYSLGVVAKKAQFLYDYTYYGRGSYKWTIAEWLGKNISGQIKELIANEKMNEERMLSEVIKALNDNVDKQLTVDKFSPIKYSIIQAHIQHFGIKPITQRKDRWEGYSAKTVNKLLSDLDLDFTTTKSNKQWSIHEKQTENESSNQD